MFDDFEEGTSFVSWACRIAYFRILRFREKRKRDRHSQHRRDAHVDRDPSGNRRQRADSDRVGHGARNRTGVGVGRCGIKRDPGDFRGTSRQDRQSADREFTRDCRAHECLRCQGLRCSRRQL